MIRKDADELNGAERGGFRIDALPAAARLTGELTRRLAAEIRTGKLQAGDRLPTEQEIMRRAGVSRTVVREAVAALRAEGLVTTRQGVGAFVAPNAGMDPFRIDAAEAASLQQVMRILELRIGVETEAAGLAAQRRTPAAIAAIAAAHQGFADAISRGEVAVDADFAFHRAVFAATDNPYFLRFLDFLGQIIIPRQLVRSGAGLADERRAYLRKVGDEHAGILRAVRAGDAEAARTAMHGHLTAGRERYRALMQTAADEGVKDPG